MRILIVEDEIDLANAMKKGVESHGYSVDLATDGQHAINMTEVYGYDLVVLDINLPILNGLEVCRKIRADSSSIGILMLTARSSVSDRIIGLNIGADDYLVKPFHFPELLARIRAILRREKTPRSLTLKIGAVELNTNTLKAYVGGEETPFTLKEFRLLEYLLWHAGRIISQEELIEHVWNETANPFTHSVKVHMNNIKRKLEAKNIRGFIQTVRGRGYLVREPESKPESIDKPAGKR